MPSIRLVDVSEGVIGIEWIEGSSVRHLLPGGAEEEVDESQTSEEEFDPLSDYKITQGKPSRIIIACMLRLMCLCSSRNSDGINWDRDRQNAPGRCHSWGFDNVEYNASAAISSATKSNWITVGMGLSEQITSMLICQIGSHRFRSGIYLQFSRRQSCRFICSWKSIRVNPSRFWATFCICSAGLPEENGERMASYCKKIRWW